MRVDVTELPGVVSIIPDVRADSRGSFHEAWQLRRYADAGLPTHWVQDNVSRSARGVLRGLHFQHPYGQGKLVSVLEGEILDVALDVRRGSPTFGRAAVARLSEENARQVYVPPGCAHGFLVLSDAAIVHYKCTEYYRGECERILVWNDPSLAIQWPIDSPILSAKDAAGRRLSQLGHDELPTYDSQG